MKTKTMVEIYHDDKKDLHICKIITNAKNIPDVLHEAIQKLKQEVEKDGIKNTMD